MASPGGRGDSPLPIGGSTLSGDGESRCAEYELGDKLRPDDSDDLRGVASDLLGDE